MRNSKLAKIAAGAVVAGTLTFIPVKDALAKEYRLAFAKPASELKVGEGKVSDSLGSSSTGDYRIGVGVGYNSLGTGYVQGDISRKVGDSTYLGGYFRFNVDTELEVDPEVTKGTRETKNLGLGVTEVRTDGSETKTRLNRSPWEIGAQLVYKVNDWFGILGRVGFRFREQREDKTQSADISQYRNGNNIGGQSISGTEEGDWERTVDSSIEVGGVFDVGDKDGLSLEAFVRGETGIDEKGDSVSKGSAGVGLKYTW